MYPIPFWTARGRYAFFLTSGLVLMLVGAIMDITLVWAIGIVLLVMPAILMLPGLLRRPRAGRGP